MTNRLQQKKMQGVSG